MYRQASELLYDEKTRETAAKMLDELDAGYLEVCKVPGRFGGYVRVPVSVNAEWYRRFCRRFVRSRKRYPKPRTIIRRVDVRNALLKIINNQPGQVNVGRLLEHIEREGFL